MFEAVTNTRSRWRTFSPKVDDIAGAEEAIRFGTWMTFFAAGAELLGVAIGFILGGGMAALLRLGNVAYFCVLASGIQRKWRSAAVIGLLLQSLGLVGVIVQGGFPHVLMVAALVGFLNAVRGIYAVRRLAAVPSPPEPATV
jgi:hypothetical protein